MPQLADIDRRGAARVLRTHGRLYLACRAAAAVVNMSYTVGQLHKCLVDLYERLPAETDQHVSFHVAGNLRLATCKERRDGYLKYCGTANTIGVPFKVLSPREAKELWPLVELGNSGDTPAIVGAIYHPDDGHIAPADLTMALRKGARGAEFMNRRKSLP